MEKILDIDATTDDDMNNEANEDDDEEDEDVDVDTIWNKGAELSGAVFADGDRGEILVSAGSKKRQFFGPIGKVSWVEVPNRLDVGRVKCVQYI